MSITKTFSFTNPANYTYDSDKIEISSGARLKLVDNPDQLFSQNFVSDSGFTYDSDLIEFSSDQVQQKDTRPANATFYASYTNNINGNWGNGILTGTAIGGASVVSEQLDLAHNDTRYIDYDANGNADSQQTGCIRFKVTPQYATWPSTGKAFFVIGKQNGSLWNLIQLQHKSNGQLSLAFYDQTGGVIYDSDLGVWSPTEGVTYEIEFNWDITTGATRLFIDGVQHGSTITNTGTRDSDINLFRIGSSYNAGYTSDFYIEDFLIFSTVQHTSNYTPDWSDVYETIYIGSKVELPAFTYSGLGNIQSFTNITSTKSGTPKFVVNDLWYSGGWTSSDGTYSQSNTISEILAQIDTLPETDTVNIDIVFDDGNTQSSVDELILTYTGQIYPTDNPTILINDYFDMEDLLGFSESSTLSGSDLIKYILSKDGTYYYWNGSAWVESDETYSQTNTAAEIEANKDSFMSSEARVFVKIFLHSENGGTTPELTSTSVSYDFGGDISEPTTIIVWGTEYYPDGTPSQEPIIVELEPNANEYSTSNQIVKKKITITPRSNGYWEQELVDNTNMETDSHYIFRFGNRIEKKVVPSGTSVNYNSLTDYDD